MRTPDTRPRARPRARTESRCRWTEPRSKMEDRRWNLDEVDLPSSIFHLPSSVDAEQELPSLAPDPLRIQVRKAARIAKARSGALRSDDAVQCGLRLLRLLQDRSGAHSPCTRLVPGRGQAIRPDDDHLPRRRAAVEE